MYIDEIHEKINSLFPECICSNKCIENGKIRWNDDDGFYLHLRIDHCVIKDEPYKRADCAIFSKYVEDSQVYLYVIEVKDNRYSLSEVKEKISNTIVKLYDELDFINERIIIIPVLYANKHISNAKRTFHAYTIRIKGKKQSIKYLHNGSNIIKAIM